MRALVRPLLAVAACATLTGAAPDRCRNAVGTHDGGFFTFWRDAGSACLRLEGAGGFAVSWRLGERGNLVAGRGWRRGRYTQVIRYRAASFTPGTNGYLSLYGWSRDPLVEYYVVDDWGDFIPPGPEAVSLGTLDSDGGTYRVYRTRRVEQPSIAGRASFDQYWSVRTARRPIGGIATITLANHVAAWRRLGLRLGRPDYQVVAAEGFGSTGEARISVARR